MFVPLKHCLVLFALTNLMDVSSRADDVAPWLDHTVYRPPFPSTTPLPLLLLHLLLLHFPLSLSPYYPA